MNKCVTILSFSSRTDGNCAKISEFISNHYEQMTVYSFIIGGAFQPCGSCGYECLKQGQRCPQLNEQQKTVMDAICTSELVYFIVPNYCGFPCANYFAFNERSVGYFGMDRDRMERYMNVPKRFIIVSNTEGFEDAMHQQTIGDPDILYLKSRNYQKQSIAGDLLDSAAAKSDLNAFLTQEH